MSTKKRPDLTAQPLIPRKEDVQPSVPLAEIDLPQTGRQAAAKAIPESVPPAKGSQKLKPGPKSKLLPSVQEDRVLNMSFRITARQLLRLKGLALLTNRSQQEVLHDILERELNATGF
jgi:hypothetical protein